MYGERLNQLDFRTSKTFRMNGGRRLQLFLDLYNLFNANPVLSYNQTYSPTTTTWLTPTSVLAARVMKIGASIDF